MLPTKPLRLACLLSTLCCLVSPLSVDAEELSFLYDVMPVLSKAGCNLGTCHGNSRGKGGFQISLRGQDPDSDFSMLTHDLFGRRVNTADPDRSLILLKPTMQLPHEGGKRFELNSSEYNVLRSWIAAGLPHDSIGHRQLIQLDVTPSELYLKARDDDAIGENVPRWQVQIEAKASFSDGTVRDVSSLAVYEIAQPIADVSSNGLVIGRHSGETTVLVRYLDRQAAVRLAFIENRPDFVWSGTEPANLVDENVLAKLRKLQINPSAVCDDATFIRRVTLDLIGLLPTADEARRFVSSDSADKRSALIDSLLERPEFSEWWAMKWADLLRIEEKTLDRKGVEGFYCWLREAFANNKPLDQFVREIVTGRGSTYEVPQANFYRALRTPFERSEAVGQLFLGVRLQCSKCHNHPFDRWTQDDYYGWGSVFAPVDYKIMENRRLDSNDMHEFDGEQIVFLNASLTAKDPRVGKPRSPRFLGNSEDLAPEKDPLNALADWLTEGRNERFVQMLANRTWQQVMSRGIVDPVDDFRATNPPSNPELLKALSDQLAFGADGQPATPSVADGSVRSTRQESAGKVGAFDLRHLLRTILNSKTYQFSSSTNETNRTDEANFSRAIVRRHSAEQILDAISQALDVPLDFSRYPKGRRAGQLPGVPIIRTSVRPNENRTKKKNRQIGETTDADRFLRLFGKPPRLQSCDCERSEETTLGQTFQMVSGPLINQMLATDGNRLDRLLASKQSAEEILTELYWTTLTRAPSSRERTETVRLLEHASNPRAVLEDIAWALFNSNEFLLRR
jgi:hypothetical protein